MRATTHPQAQFLWAMFRDLFHYTAFHLADIADTARDVDFAIRWGYGWKLGPFETWQAAGWKQVAEWIAEDIAAGKAMSDAPLPDWVTDGRDGVHARRGFLVAGQGKNLPRSTRPSTSASCSLIRCSANAPDRATTVSKTTACGCGTLGDDIGIVSFKTKMHTVNDAVLDGLQRGHRGWPRSELRGAW